MLHMNNSYDPERSLGLVIHDISRLLRKRFDRRAQTLGLTRAQWQAIVHLRRFQGITQTRLADLLDVEKITVARLIDRLEAAGWVERRPHPSDRRANCLYLTDKVSPIMDDMQRLALDVRAEALQGFSDDEQQVLMAGLHRIKKNLLELEPCCGSKNRASGDDQSSQ